MELGWTYRSSSAEETKEFAVRLSQLLQPSDVLALVGDLGAGKTTFTQGLAVGLGVNERVNSPTFTIIKEYEGRIPLYHMDVYRLGGSEDLGFEEYFHGDGVTVVEWPSRIEEILPEQLLWIEITAFSADERELKLIPHGDRYIHICKELRDEYSRN